MNSSPMTSPILSIEQLSASINDQPILRELDLNIYPGQIHAIMGPNGSGKSTLSKIIAGHPAYQVTHGSMTYVDSRKNKVNLLETPIEERSLSGIFLGLQYPIEISGITNFDFLYEVFKQHCLYQGTQLLDQSEFKNLLNEYLEVLKMKETFLTRSLNEGFSGGEKKKNDILQMLVLRPRLIILDETDSGLDIDALKTVSQGIERLKNQRTSIVLITHYQRLLDYLVPDVVHVMLAGKIVKEGNFQLAKELELKGYESLKS